MILLKKLLSVAAAPPAVRYLIVAIKLKLIVHDLILCSGGLTLFTAGFRSFTRNGQVHVFINP